MAFDHTEFLSEPGERPRIVREIFTDLLHADVIVAAETETIPLVATLTASLNIGMLYIREKAKGRGVVKMVEGMEMVDPNLRYLVMALSKESGERACLILEREAPEETIFLDTSYHNLNPSEAEIDAIF